MPESLYRAAVGGLLVAAMAISLSFRRRADQTGGGISRARDGMTLAVALTIFGVAGAVSLLAWLIRPETLDWSRVHLPDWARLAGIALSTICILLIVWMFRHLGANVTATSIVRENATLVTTGPYRYIRHPMYTFGSLFYLGLSIAMDTWLVGAIVAGAFVLIAYRTRHEEANLRARFGPEYQDYRARTGRFLPKVRGGPRVE
jgi:protein-S-isoprenylcysteine O-methyltransferase Ste14